MSVGRTYTREMREETGYSATWLPTVSLELGDVGVLIDYSFAPITTLHNLGVPFQTSAASARSDISYTSAGAVSVEVKASAEVEGVGATSPSARMIIGFSRSEAIVFAAGGCRTRVIDDVASLAAEILRRSKMGDWPADWVVVTEVLGAARTSVLISSGTGASMELDLDVAVPASPAALASSEVHASVRRERNIGMKLICAGQLTPLFRTIGVRKRLFREDQVRSGATLPVEDEIVVEVEYDDYAT